MFIIIKPLQSYILKWKSTWQTELYYHRVDHEAWWKTAMEGEEERKSKRGRDVLEGRRVGRPLRNVLIKRMTMEPEIISPIMNRLLLHVKTRRESHRLRRVI